MVFLSAIISYRRQWLATLSLSLGAMLIGATTGWASPYIAKLTAPNSTHPLTLTLDEASWIASLTAVGRLFGAAMGAIIQELFGRKMTLLLMSGPLGVGWALIIIAPAVSWLYASRILSGIAMGMTYSAAASFLGEIAATNIRGSLILFNTNAIAGGVLLGSIMGGLLSLEIFSYVCIVTTGLFIVSFVFVPESPYYHMARGDIQKAEESLKWFNEDVNVKEETSKLQDFIGTISNVGVVNRLKEFKKPQHQKSLLIIVLINMFLYCAGMNVTNTYAEVILRNSKVEMTPSIIVMGLSFSALIAGTAALVLVDKLGRRCLLISSGLGLSAGHILLGSHFHMLSLGINPKSISWLPVLSLFLVDVSIPFGLGTVRFSLLGELFPPVLKTPASFISTVSTGILSFIVSKSFQPYVDLVGEKYVYWTFAMSALCSTAFSYFCIAETMRISLIDIQTNLKKDTKTISAKSAGTINLYNP